MRVLVAILLLAISLGASPEALTRANALYERTDYAGSLRILENDAAPGAETWLLRGKNHFMLSDYKAATDSFEKAISLAPTNSECQLWLGRAWGRRAETNALMAMVYAPRARQAFEKAVNLDPHNHEARNDLFDYYLNAPGMMGGGIDKAEALARNSAIEQPAEYEFQQAEIAGKKNDFKAVEAHFRRAMELAPDEPGRIVDLARFLAKRGRFEESDQFFSQARRLAPHKPGVAFAEAKAYVDHNRNLEQARRLLQEYMKASLTPEDPTRQEAAKLLQKAGK